MTHQLDFLLFALYLVANIALGLYVARRKTADARGYFLAGDRLPWYAIGGSIIAAKYPPSGFMTTRPSSVHVTLVPPSVGAYVMEPRALTSSLSSLESIQIPSAGSLLVIVTVPKPTLEPRQCQVAPPPCSGPS